MSLLELFCQVDDFCRTFLPMWRQLQLEWKGPRPARDSWSERNHDHPIGHLRSAVDRQTQVQHEEPLNALADRLLLRKRALIEKILDQLRNISQIEHTRLAARTILWLMCRAA